MRVSAIEDVTTNNLYIGKHTVNGQKKNIIGADTISVNPTKIAVFGVGGGGVNAINYMISTEMTGVTLYAANTDVQTLQTSLAENVIPLGTKTCRGLGVGGDPMRGAEAAKEVTEPLEELIRSYDMVFLASGFGGGTGTGATPIIADIARNCGVLTIGVITMPFKHEGIHRVKNAQQGLEDLENLVDALLVIPNDNILANDVISPDLTIDQSFALINKILSDAVSAITDIITIPGTINIDFADIEACLKGAGRVSIGIGQADAQNESGGSVHRATDLALKNKIIDRENNSTLQTAEKIVVNVVAGKSVSTPELMVVPNLITDRVKRDTPNLKFGYRIEPSWENKVAVTIIASSTNDVSFEQNAFSNPQQKRNNMQETQHGFRDSVIEKDINGNFVDSNNFSRLFHSPFEEKNEDEILSYTLNSEELDDPALERIVNMGSFNKQIVDDGHLHS